MDKVDLIIEKAAKYLNNVASATMVLMMVLITGNVILRTVFNKSILGTNEYTGFLSAVLISCGLAYCTLADGHISIGILVDKFKRKTQKTIHEITQAFSLIIMIGFAYSIVSYGIRLMDANQVSPTTQTPFYIFVFIVAVSFFVFSLAIFTKLIHSIKEEVNDE